MTGRAEKPRFEQLKQRQRPGWLVAMHAGRHIDPRPIIGTFPCHQGAASQYHELAANKTACFRFLRKLQ